MRSRRTSRRYSSPTARDAFALGLLLCALSSGCSGATSPAPSPAPTTPAGPSCRPTVLYAPTRADRDEQGFRQNFCVHLGVAADDDIFFTGSFRGRNTIAGRSFDGSFAGELSPGGGVPWLEAFPVDMVHDIATAPSVQGFAIVVEINGIERMWGERRMPPGEFIVRFDAAGSISWVQPLKGRTDRTTNIAMDGAGNVFATGWAPGPLESNAIAVIKLDARGALQWQKQLPGSSGSSKGAPDSYDDRYIIAHGDALYLWIESNGEKDDPLFTDLVKLGTDGSEQWRRTLTEASGKPRSYVYSPHLAVDRAGNVYMATTFNGVVKLADGRVITDPNKHYLLYGGTGLLMKVDPQGKLLFATTFESSENGMYIDALTIDGDDHPWIVGGFSEFVVLGGLRLDRPSPRVPEGPFTVAFLAGFDQEGHARRLSPLAWGIGQALVARSKDLLLTIKYSGDFLMKDVAGAPRYENGAACIALRVPTGIGDDCK